MRKRRRNPPETPPLHVIFDNPLTISPLSGDFNVTVQGLSKPPGNVLDLRFNVIIFDPIRTQEGVLAMQMTTTQRCLMSVDQSTLVDAEGNPTQIKNMAWATDDSQIAFIDPASITDGYSAMVKSPSPGAPGSTVGSFDFDQPDGTHEKRTFAIDITAGNAAIVNLVAGTPEEDTGSSAP